MMEELVAAAWRLPLCQIWALYFLFSAYFSKSKVASIYYADAGLRGERLMMFFIDLARHDMRRAVIALELCRYPLHLRLRYAMSGGIISLKAISSNYLT